MTKAGTNSVENLVDSFHSKILNSRRNYFGTFEGFEPEIFLFYKLFHSTRICFEEPGPDTKFISKIKKPNSLNFFLHTSFIRILLMAVDWNSNKSNNTVRKDIGVARNESFQSIRPAKSFLKTT